MKKSSYPLNEKKLNYGHLRKGLKRKSLLFQQD
jgi:hypothetical protein